jgi:hypothetical protein
MHIDGCRIGLEMSLDAESMGAWLRGLRISRACPGVSTGSPACAAPFMGCATRAGSPYGLPGQALTSGRGDVQIGGQLLMSPGGQFQISFDSPNKALGPILRSYIRWLLSGDRFQRPGGDDHLPVPPISSSRSAHHCIILTRSSQDVKPTLTAVFA